MKCTVNNASLILLSADEERKAERTDAAFFIFPATELHRCLKRMNISHEIIR